MGSEERNGCGYYVGLDWGNGEHRVCVEDGEGKVLRERGFPAVPEGVYELCGWLEKVCGVRASSICVGIETPHGPVVETLLEAGFAVYSINPRQADRFRDRFSMSGAKDDRRDAKVLADSLRTDMSCYVKLEPDNEAVIKIRELSRLVSELTRERTRYSNRLRSHLSRYYPQALDLTSDVSASWFLELLKIAPTPMAGKHVRKHRVAKILREYHVRKLDSAQVKKILRRPGYNLVAGTVEACKLHVNLIVQQLELVNSQLKATTKELDNALKVLPNLRERSEEDDDDVDSKEQRSDVEILFSLPGIGHLVLATLLGEASKLLASKKGYQILRSLSGISPVTRSSGKKRVVAMRRACNHRLRFAVYHWAFIAVQTDAYSKAHYADLRKKGHNHARALRGVADRLLRVAYVMLQNRTLYDPSKRQYPKKQKEAA